MIKDNYQKLSMQVNEKVLPLEILEAKTSYAKRKGLLLFESIDNQGLLLKRCPSIHMIGMQFSIDVVFIRKNKIVKLYPFVSPGFKLKNAFASSALELEAGAIGKYALQKGDFIYFNDFAKADAG